MKNSLLTATILWPLLVVLCSLFVLRGLFLTIQRTDLIEEKKSRIFWTLSGILVGWALLVSSLSLNGFFEGNRLPPRPVLAMALPLPFVLAFAFSKTGSVLLTRVPAHWLIFMQSFRIAVELLIWLAFLSGKLPVQMSFEGRNFDVLAGLLAIVAGVTVMKKKGDASRMILGYNIIGLALLINILVIALLSMPTPFRVFLNGPSSAIVGQFPYILLPTILVPLAYSLHIFSLRQLVLKRRATHNAKLSATSEKHEKYAIGEPKEIPA